VRPSEEEALRIHRKYGSSDRIIAHCRTVAKVAEALAEGIRRQGKAVDVEAVAAGAFLHDIGRNKTQTVRHGLEGSLLLAQEGVDDAVVQIVRRHVGAGLSAEEAKALGLPGLDYFPRRVEEAIVCFADKMVDADRLRPFEVEVRRFGRKGLDVEKLRALKRRIETDLGTNPEAFIFEKLKETG
jgi:uncharacterized protein